MNDINSIIITGRLVKNATQVTEKIMSFDVAVNRSYKNANGEKVDEVTYITCKMYGPIVEVLIDKLQKGTAITLKGYIKQENWEDKETGQKKSKLVLIGESILISGSSSSSSSSSKAITEEPEDDLPF